MKLRRRHLTLLEVLISFTLIILCLYPLLSPHVSFYQTQRKLGDQIRMNLAIGNWYATFYEELLKKERVWETIVFDVSQNIEGLPEKASYTLKKIGEKRNEQEEAYLLELAVNANADDYIYYFIVKRQLSENQTEKNLEKKVPDPS